MFFIAFGGGKAGSETFLGPTSRLVMTYTYVHVFWVFTLAWNRYYEQASWTEQGWALQHITPAHADALCGGTAPDISNWKRYSLVGAFSTFVLLIAVALSFAG